MKKFTIHYHKLRVAELKVLFCTFLLALFFIPNFRVLETGEDNRFTIFLFDTNVGVVESEEKAETLLRQARKEVATGSDGLYFIDDFSLRTEGSEVFWGKADSDEFVIDNMKKVLAGHRRETLGRSYTVKVNECVVNLSSAEDVKTLLSNAVAKYDTESKFELSMDFDGTRKLGVLSPQIEKKKSGREDINLSAGAENVFTKCEEDFAELETTDFEDYELGITQMSFSENVEVVESYVPRENVISMEEAASLLTEEQEVMQIYEVQSGDTLSEISLTVGIPMETIVEMNSDYMDDINSPLQIGQELIITVPEPVLAVEYTIREHYEESYEAEIQYVDNDTWYTTQKVTLQEPSAGYREVIADRNCKNDEEISKDVVKEEVLMEAVPKIVERGTIVPPTYIKPISGGRLSSGFGRRTAPKKGASTYHKGVDWATPIGTPVYASSGGVVAKAGWGKGYGNVIYINHPDGRQTRYGHLSKILVKEGQTVSQSDKIALSGNSGVSTGPHIHFEILINGSQVNPLNYLN